MNQAILFPEREEWDQQRQSIVFPALVNGHKVNCIISLNRLTTTYTNIQSIDKESLLIAFRQHRWDIEDDAEQRIKQQQYNQQGEVEL